MDSLYFQGLILLLSQHIIGLLMPGPTMALIIRNSTEDRMAGLYTLSGACVAGFLVKSSSILGLAFLLTQIPLLFDGIKIIGGTYMLYLGVKAALAAFKDWQEYRHHKHDPEYFDVLGGMPHEPHKNAPFITGFLVNLTNPLASIRFIAIFGSLVPPGLTLPLQLSYVVATTLTSLIFYVPLCLFFSTPKLQQGMRTYRFILNTILSLVLWYSGVKVLLLSY